MKQIILILCCLLSYHNSQAQSIFTKPLKSEYNNFGDRIKLGIHVGVDVGAAAPWPISSAISGSDKIHATPRVSTSLGLMTGVVINERWSINTEVSYRTVGVNATIVTLEKGQNFTMDGEKVLFRGQATMYMSFSQMEIPIYAKWEVNRTNAITLGLFYAYVANGQFIAYPVQGTTTNANTPDAVPEPVQPGSVPDQDFSNSLSNWDIGYQLGYERRLGEHISVAGRFTMGVKDIFKPNEKYLDYSMLQMRGTLQLSYRFL